MCSGWAVYISCTFCSGIDQLLNGRELPCSTIFQVKEKRADVEYDADTVWSYDKMRLSALCWKAAPRTCDPAAHSPRGERTPEMVPCMLRALCQDLLTCCKKLNPIFVGAHLGFVGLAPVDEV